MLVPLILGCATVYISMGIQIAAIVYMLQSGTLADDLLSKTRILSPIDGVVIQLDLIAY